MKLESFQRSFASKKDARAGANAIVYPKQRMRRNGTYLDKMYHHYIYTTPTPLDRAYALPKLPTPKPKRNQLTTFPYIPPKPSWGNTPMADSTAAE
jgi:hypothetical protein